MKKDLDAVEELLFLDALCDGPLQGVTDPNYLSCVFSLRASSCLLTVAIFENFLRTLCEAFIEHINTQRNQIPWSNLPEKLQETHIFESALPKKSSVFPNETKAMFHARMLREVGSIATNIASPLAGGRYHIVLHGFLQTNSNPNSDAISGMMKRIGCDRVFGNPIIQRYMHSIDSSLTNENAIVVKINDLVQRRHSVAHGRLSNIQNISRADIEYGVKFFTHLARALERVARDCVLNL